jgi:hypothetical protein
MEVQKVKDINQTRVKETRLSFYVTAELGTGTGLPS